MPTFMDRNPELRSLIASSDITAKQFAEYTEKVLGFYTKYANGLPDDSAWKHGKVEHVTHGAREVATHADLFGLKGIELDVVSFPLIAHDTGRLIHEHIQRGSGSIVPWRHGVESALLAKEAFGDFARSALGKAILLAIKHHSDMTTPSVADLNGSKAAHALTGIVRDFDKMAGYDDALRYVADDTFKRQQINTNYSTQRKNDPTWGEEKGEILPHSHFELFLSGKALERRACQSYEAYMAQYLAWLFDVQNDEVLRLCVERGGPKHVLRYLLAQLEKGSPHQYDKLLAWSKSWKGGLLSR